MNNFSCKILAQHPTHPARVTEIPTAHGKFVTPAFMPVGTRAGVNNLTPQELTKTGSQIILGGNTYHMLCAPGMQVIEEAGGMHPFMRWHGPMLTDSGGFQIFSLSQNEKLCHIDEQGARFTLPSSDTVITMTPESSLATQKIIGADIIMAFDQCTKDQAPYEEVQHILTRTTRWLHESLNYHKKYPLSRYGYPQALFGIIQGGIYEDLRLQSTQTVVDMDLDGIAIGGETIGFDMQKTVSLLRLITPLLPKEKPRYTMGVGLCPQDLIDVIAEGIDMFDCVAPTRNARHGALYCGELIQENGWFRFVSPYPHQRIMIKKAIFANDFSPIMPTCTCITCKTYPRAYLHALCKQKSPVFTAAASLHNIHVMHQVCDTIRRALLSS